MKATFFTLLLALGGSLLAQNIPAGAIAINEFVADNDSLSRISDPDGGYPDWIELYNTTGQAIDLTNVSLSDKPDNLNKWRFPAGTTIAADGYLIIWADEDEDEQGLHANFKLSKNGEAIYLSNAGDTTRIDEVEFGEQAVNISSSRVPNGTGPFVAQHTTHGFSNDTPVSTGNPENDWLLSPFPNPATDLLSFDLPATSASYWVTITAINSQEVMQTSGYVGNHGRYDIPVGYLTPGTYLLSVFSEAGGVRTAKFIKQK